MDENGKTPFDKKIDELRKALGECFKCSHHNCIEKQCRVSGTFCKYPTTGCNSKDYPWGN